MPLLLSMSMLNCFIPGGDDAVDGFAWAITGPGIGVFDYSEEPTRAVCGDIVFGGRRSVTEAAKPNIYKVVREAK